MTTIVDIKNMVDPAAAFHQYPGIPAEQLAELRAESIWDANCASERWSYMSITDDLALYYAIAAAVESAYDASAYHDDGEGDLRILVEVICGASRLHQRNGALDARAFEVSEQVVNTLGQAVKASKAVVLSRDAAALARMLEDETVLEDLDPKLRGFTVRVLKTLS